MKIDADSSGTISRIELVGLVRKMQSQKQQHRHTPTRKEGSHNQVVPSPENKKIDDEAQLQREVDQLMKDIASKKHTERTDDITYEEFQVQGLADLAYLRSSSLILQIWWQDRELRRMYNMYDCDSDGHFDDEEFKMLLCDLGVPAAEQTGLFQQMDNDGNRMVRTICMTDLS